MNRQTNPRWRRLIGPSRVLAMLLGALLLGALALAPVPSRADEEDGEAEYVRIEEDWSLTVNDPDPQRGAPQVATQMAPSPWSRYFFVFQINYRELSDFVEGGLQAQIWKDNSIRDWKSAGIATMGTPNEVVTWTQSMERDGAELKFKIKSGSSTTWGDLAEAGLQVKTANGRAAFTTYSSDYSTEKSGITYGANRVNQLTLVEVRKYKADGTCDQETTPRIVFQAVTTTP
jgi:hypothetical protein